MIWHTIWTISIMTPGLAYISSLRLEESYTQILLEPLISKDGTDLPALVDNLIFPLHWSMGYETKKATKKGPPLKCFNFFVHAVPRCCNFLSAVC